MPTLSSRLSVSANSKTRDSAGSIGGSISGSSRVSISSGGSSRGETRASVIGGNMGAGVTEGGAGTWASRPFSGSWGMPTPSEMQEQMPEVGNKAPVIEAKDVRSKVKLWKEQGLTPEDLRDRAVRLARVR